MKKIKTKNRNMNKGFSLIELLLVLSILAILSAVVVTQFSGQKQKSKVIAAKTQLSELDTAIAIFENQNDAPPSEDQGLDALYNRPAEDLENWTRLLKKPIENDPWGSPYVYRQPGEDDNPYDLYSIGPDKIDGTEDDVTN